MNAIDQATGRRPPVHCIGIHDKTPEMRTLYVSSNIRQVIQCEPSELIGQPSLPFVASENAEDYKQLMEAQNLNKVVVTEVLARLPMGEMYYIRIIHFNCDNIALNLCTVYPDRLPEPAIARPMRFEVFDPNTPQAQELGGFRVGSGSSSQIPQTVNSMADELQTQSSRIMRYAQTRTKACLILVGSLSMSEENNPLGPNILFASNSFTRILDAEISDIQGLSFLSLIAAHDTIKAARFLEKMTSPERIVLDRLKFLANPVDTDAEDVDHLSVVTVEVLGAGSDEGAIILCQLDNASTHRSRDIDDDDELNGYMSLEDIITSDPESSDVSDMWKTNNCTSAIKKSSTRIATKEKIIETMRDYLLYGTHATHSDDTIYSTSSAADGAKVQRRQKPVMRTTAGAVTSGPRAQQQQLHSAHEAGGGLSDAAIGAHKPPAVNRVRPAQGSPTSTGSERTLARAASRGSMRNERTEEPRRRKRGSMRSDGRAGTFISQLLRGASRSRSPHHNERAEPAQNIEPHGRSPGTPHSHVSGSSQSPASIDDAGAAGDGHFHVSQCSFVPPGAKYEQPSVYCVEAEDGSMYYAHATGPTGAAGDGSAYSSGMDPAYATGMGPAYSTSMDPAYGTSHIDPSYNTSGVDSAYGAHAWYGDSPDAVHSAGRLVSSLPVYEPIDPSRAHPIHPFGRATRPILPDARMLAPMASLADTYNPTDYTHTLSTRELRFAVENHMLVEQHRYLIRDLGHARSAIGALKQVVQAKEERFDYYETMAGELQQRVALLESLLTNEQRGQLAHMPYTAPVSEGHVSSASLTEAPAAKLSDGPDNSDPAQGVGDVNQSSADAKRIHRPLSGYATGYSFSDKPVHQLPRVFSGDYTSSMHEMESSVEALATAISALPRDADSVEDIIANKSKSVAQDEPKGADGQGQSRGDEPKRRSRFFSALRMPVLTALSGSTSESAPGSGSGAGSKSSKRRSVSLGISRPLPPAPSTSAPDRSQVISPKSLAASCPTLAPAISASQPKSQRLSSADSIAVNGRYPTGLGLGSGAEAGSRRSSQQSYVSNNQTPVLRDEQPTKQRRRNISQRLSFTPQPRRSTSAPSRPHSMRVTSRRSWIRQLFGVGNATPSDNEFGVGVPRQVDEDMCDDTEDFALEGQRGRRRRVMTQSSAEVSKYLGQLRLEEPPHMGARCVLEDLIDDIGEDEEQMGLSTLSVSEIRQQTLDALNGSTRGRSGGPDSGLDVAGSRWRHREAISPTITRLSNGLSLSVSRATSSDSAKVLTGSNAPSSPGSAGLGVSVTRRCSVQSPGANNDAMQSEPQPRRSLGQRSQSWAQPSLPEPHSLDSPVRTTNLADDSDISSNGKRWAPAFWAPPPLALHPACAISPSAATWSPRVSIDSADTSRRTSEDARHRSSLTHHRAGSSSSGSPWELIKIADARNFAISPSLSPLPNTASRALPYFEDTTVPDSDELTMAARRSLSLRMSQNSFRQAEPLPESDDAEHAPVPGDFGDFEYERRDASDRHVRNPTLARVASTTSHAKRRSLLWQINAKLTPKPSGESALSTNDQPAPADVSASHDSLPPPLSRRPKKWWSVLG
ncbi:hypothetical protein GGH96_003158 [Coemansia sp. RSA 1972]|nr:hypothetical protein GGH96_003158 [Coemansia sp. RSA 1972]